jgi:hypothetical protein
MLSSLLAIGASGREGFMTPAIWTVWVILYTSVLQTGGGSTVTHPSAMGGYLSETRCRQAMATFVQTHEPYKDMYCHPITVSQ